MLPLGPPDRYGSPYKARSAFAAWPGLLESPHARVSRAEALDFRGREAAWIEDWSASPAVVRSPTRSASSASGRRCAPTRPSAACS